MKTYKTVTARQTTFQLVCLHAIALGAALLANTKPAIGQPVVGYNQVIVKIGDLAPDGNGTFLSLPSGPKLNNQGQVSFNASLSNAGLANWGVFLGSANGVVQIVRNGQPEPGGNGYFNSTFNNPALNHVGQVSFVAGLTQTPGQAFDDGGIFSASAGGATPIVRKGQSVPNGNGNYNVFSTDTLINDVGQVAFYSTLNNTSGGSGDNEAIFLSSNNGLVQIVRKGQLAPNGGTFVGITQMSLNNAGQVAFRGDFSGQANQRIFRSDGGVLTEIARVGQLAPDGVSTFSSLVSPQMNNAGQIVFQAGLNNAPFTSNKGIFVGTGSGIIEIARRGENAPGTGTAITMNAVSPLINDSGQVAFSSDLAGNAYGIFRYSDGHLQTLAITGQSAPGGNGTFTGLDHLAFNNGGIAAFRGEMVGTSGGNSDNRGIFLADGTEMITVVRKGDIIGGSQVTNVSFAFGGFINGAQRTGLNDYGQVAYYATRANGHHFIGLFTPVCNYRSAVDGSFDFGGDWTLSIKPSNPHDVVVNPTSNLKVVKGSGSLNINSLIVGQDTGIATIDLAPNSRIDTLLGATFGVNSVLTGHGTIGGGDVTVSGKLAPGSSAGELSFDTNLLLSSSAILDMEIGGLLPGLEFDRILVSGDLYLDGTLQVSLLNGFSPSAGQSFELFGVSPGSISGTFHTLELPSLSAGLQWDTSNLYSGGYFTVISAVPEGNFIGLLAAGLLALQFYRRKRPR